MQMANRLVLFSMDDPMVSSDAKQAVTKTQGWEHFLTNALKSWCNILRYKTREPRGLDIC